MKSMVFSPCFFYWSNEPNEKNDQKYSKNKRNEQATGMQCTEYLYIPATRRISRAYLTTTHTLIKKTTTTKIFEQFILAFFLYTVLILIYIKIYIYFECR